MRPGLRLFSPVLLHFVSLIKKDWSQGPGRFALNAQ